MNVALFEKSLLQVELSWGSQIILDLGWALNPMKDGLIRETQSKIFNQGHTEKKATWIWK